MARLRFDDVKRLVQTNNRSQLVSDRLLLCLIWKESGFDDAAQNSQSTAAGLMQVTTEAVDDVNRHTAKGVHFTYAEMTDSAKNIQCGSYYLDIRIKRAGDDVKKGIERFGTGSGYADNLLACEACLKDLWVKKSADQQRPCLYAIHK